MVTSLMLDMTKAAGVSACCDRAVGDVIGIISAGNAS